MSGVGDYLWRDVLGRSTECPRLVSGRDELGETQVNHANIAIVVDHQVLGLQIAVAIVPLVEVVEGFDHAGNVEARHRVVERTPRVQSSPQIATKVRVRKQIDKLLV